MEDPKPLQEILGALLQTNKLAIFLEIAVVFVPLYVLMIVSNRMEGDDFISLGGDLVLVGAPLVYLGMILALAAVWVTSKMRAVSWPEFGLARPTSWVRTILLGIGMTIAFMVAATLLVQLLNLVNLNTEADLSRFAPLYGNLPNLVINVVALWFTAGFVEEFLWRGYLMNRIVDFLGKNTKFNWAIALIGSSIIFGLGLRLSYSICPVCGLVRLCPFQLKL